MTEQLQMEMPILVQVTGLPIPTRFDPLEREMIVRLKGQSGLSQTEVIRRCVRLLRLEVARHGSADFLLNFDASRLDRRQAPPTGRKTTKQKKAELERSIRDHLRALELERRALAALTEGHAIPEFNQMKGAA